MKYATTIKETRAWRAKAGYCADKCCVGRNRLPHHSIKGGICNADGCLNIAKVLCGSDDLWYCEVHAQEKVHEFIDAFKSIGWPV